MSRILAVWQCFRRKVRKKDAVKIKNTVKGAGHKEKRCEGRRVVPSQDSGLLVQAVGLPVGLQLIPSVRKG